MNWRNDLKKRYASSGWEAFRTASEAFKQRLERFSAERHISITDDNPEGQDWMVRLKDGTELYIERRSYDTENQQAELWIDYGPEQGGFVAEFYSVAGRLVRSEVIIPNALISDICTEWQ